MGSFGAMLAWQAHWIALATTLFRPADRQTMTFDDDARRRQP
jgi:hypothetical protein